MKNDPEMMSTKMIDLLHQVSRKNKLFISGKNGLLQEQLQSILPESLSSSLEVISFNRGHLHLRCNQPALSQELLMQRNWLKNTLLGSQSFAGIKDIKITTGKIADFKKMPELFKSKKEQYFNKPVFELSKQEKHNLCQELLKTYRKIESKELRKAVRDKNLKSYGFDLEKELKNEDQT